MAKSAKKSVKRATKKPALSVAGLHRFLATEFPQVFHAHSGLSIEEVWHGGGRVRQAYQAQFIRPGGTISGPTMMALADFAIRLPLQPPLVRLAWPPRSDTMPESKAQRPI